MQFSCYCGKGYIQGAGPDKAEGGSSGVTKVQACLPQPTFSAL